MTWPHPSASSLIVLRPRGNDLGVTGAAPGGGVSAPQPEPGQMLRGSACSASLHGEPMLPPWGGCEPLGGAARCSSSLSSVTTAVGEKGDPVSLVPSPAAHWPAWSAWHQLGEGRCGPPAWFALRAPPGAPQEAARPPRAPGWGLAAGLPPGTTRVPSTHSRCLGLSSVIQARPAPAGGGLGASVIAAASCRGPVPPPSVGPRGARS